MEDVIRELYGRANRAALPFGPEPLAEAVP
jgi:hypothetical protein